MLFVIVNQIAYTVVVRLASSGTAEAVGRAGEQAGTGYTVYSFAFLIVMVPHSIITVSLATAMLPRLSALRRRRRPRPARRHPGDDAAQRARGRRAVRAAAPADRARRRPRDLGVRRRRATTYQNFAPSLALFGLGLVFFTVHYLMLRGFYALEQTRTVFLIQCVVAATNIVAAVLLVREATARADLAGAGARLRRRLPRGRGRLLRRARAAPSAASGPGRWRGSWSGCWSPRCCRPRWRTAYPGCWRVSASDPSLGIALLRGTAVATVDVVVFLLLARLLRLRRSPRWSNTVTRRLPLPVSGTESPYDDAVPRSQSTAVERRTVPQSARPGDVLADRYRLVDLLSESGDGRFWRAHDRVLERHVALHVHRRRRPAGRRASRTPPGAPRPCSTRGSCGCWTPTSATASASSSTSGAPAPRSTSCSPATGRCRRAGRPGSSPRWPPRSRPAHDAAVAHGRLVPENVLIDHAGSIRVIGFCVDAALHGLPPAASCRRRGRPRRAALLLLTGRWAGRLAVRRAAGASAPTAACCGRARCGPASPAPSTPVRRGPQPVRRGPRPGTSTSPPRAASADACATSSATPPGWRARTLKGIAGAGALAVPERRPERRRARARAGAEPEPTTESAAEPTAEPPPSDPEPTLVVPPAGSEPPPLLPPETGSEPAADPPLLAEQGPLSASAAPAELPTQAGLPIFDDETDDVSWLEKRPEPPPPPPPFEDPPRAAAVRARAGRRRPGAHAAAGRP